VRDAERAGQRLRRHCFTQPRHLAERAGAVQHFRRGQYRNSGRIITTVFQPPQTFEQNGCNWALRNRTNNSTHEQFSAIKSRRCDINGYSFSSITI
jgi:hypothetical protein